MTDETKPTPFLNYKNEVAFTVSRTKWTVEENDQFFDALGNSFLTLFQTGTSGFYLRLDKPNEKDQQYIHTKRSITKDDWIAHLCNLPDSELVLVPVDENHLCHWAAIDVDRHGSEAKAMDWGDLARTVTAKNLPLVVCKSGGGKGAHIFSFFLDEIPPSDAIRIMKHYIKELGLPADTEIFPKQLNIKTGSYGNGIGMPYHHRQEAHPFNPVAFDAEGNIIEWWLDFLDFAWSRAKYGTVIASHLPAEPAPALREAERGISSKPIKQVEARKLYDRSLEDLRNTPVGGRGNDQIFKTAAVAGNVLKALGKTAEQIEEELLHVVTVEWKHPHPEAQAKTTIESGLAKGLTEPRDIVLPPTLPWLNSRDPVKAEKHAAIIERIIYSASLTALIGRVKLGKTTFMLDACECICFGRPFLGEPVIAGSVLYVSEQPLGSFVAELNNSGLVESGQLILGSPEPLGQFEYVCIEHWLKYNWPEIVAATLEHAIKIGAKLVCFDTLSRIARVEDENKASEMQKAIDELAQFLPHGIAVLFVSHERKSGGDIQDAGRGSSAIVGSVDVILRLMKPTGKHPENYRQLDFIGRYPGPGVPRILERKTADRFSRYEQLANVAAVAAKSTQDKIGDMFDDWSDPEASYSLGEIVTETQCGRSTVQRVLRDLTKTHRLKKVGKGTKDDPVRYQLQETVF